MNKTPQLTQSVTQVTTWMRGLMTVAWADGEFDAQEQELIEELVSQELVPELTLTNFKPITAQELATGLGPEPQIAENFLRTAVMVALADGIYSSQEDQLLAEFTEALRVQVDALDTLRLTLNGDHDDWESAPAATEAAPDLLLPVRHWLDEVEVEDPKIARFLCKMIPSQCPFERDITLFGRKVVHIPPLCKLNPLYEQLVGLRFRALSYLADDCEEDVSAYI